MAIIAMVGWIERLGRRSSEVREGGSVPTCGAKNVVGRTRGLDALRASAHPTSLAS
jgi:hypothetical protein